MINDIKWVQAQREPEQGANYNQVSITTLRTPVAFGNEECDPVWLLLCVSATDANAHILTIQRISQFIDSPQRLAAVGNASTDDALFALVSG